MIAVGLVIAMVPIGASVGQALGAPGRASTSVRLVEWLRSGAASLVVDASGRIDVGAWRRDVGPGPGVLAVRHNVDLIYLAAHRISLSDLAQALFASGAVRGMELDIHPQMVTFTSYRPGQVPVAGVGTRLLPALQPPTDGYLVHSQRDVLAVTAR